MTDPFLNGVLVGIIISVVVVGIFLSLSWWDNRNDSRDWEEEEQQWKRYREHRDGPEDLI